VPRRKDWFLKQSTYNRAVIYVVGPAWQHSQALAVPVYTPDSRDRSGVSQEAVREDYRSAQVRSTAGACSSYIDQNLDIGLLQIDRG
jgi:hypothetical protein